MRSYNFNLIFGLFAISQCSRLYATSIGRDEAAATVVQMMDRNGDEKISPAEIYYFVRIVSRINLSNDTLAAEFKTLDLDHDGFLTASEIDSGDDNSGKKPRPPRIDGDETVKLADKDGVGVVTRHHLIHNSSSSREMV
ncbi:hypothetical protein U1Q18_046106 [Sarracenia purpurea var. burkii]